MSTSSYRGVFPAPPTPIDQAGRINTVAVKAILEDNLRHGCHGFWIAGSTGEGPILTDQQRADLAMISGEICKGKAKTIFHVGAMSLESALNGVNAAVRAGCDAICCLPPLFFMSNENSIVEFYKRVAGAAVDKDFFVYNLPQLTHVDLTPSLLSKLQKEIPNLKGLKHSAHEFSRIKDFVDMGLICFSGNGAFPLPALSMGAVGTVDAPLTLAPWHYVKLFNAWESGDFLVAQELQNKTKPIVDLVWMYSAHADVCKVVLSHRLKIDCGRSIPPVIRLSDEQRLDVLEAARVSGLVK